MFTRRLTMTVPFVSINEWISNTLNRNTKNSPSKRTYKPSKFGVLFCYIYKHLEDSKSEGKKCLKPLSSELNFNVFVYDGLIQN